MSNKQDPASEDAVAEARRLAANDAQDARDAAAAMPALPANPAVAAEPGAHDDADERSTTSAAGSLTGSSSEALPAAAARSVAAEPEYRASVQSESKPDLPPDLPPDTPPTSAAGVGTRLTRLREARRWSIEDVSTRLKVPPAKLRAIEAGDLSALPDMTFTLGVIRAYAKLLGVDSAPLAAALRQSNGPVEQDLSMPASRGGGLPRGGKMSTMSWSGPPKRRPWLWAIGAVVLAVVVLLLYRSGTEPAAWLAKLKQNAETSNPASAAANASAAEAAAGSEAPGDAPATEADGQTPAEGASDAAALSAASNNTGAMSASATTAQTLAAVSAAGPNGAVAGGASRAATGAAAASGVKSTNPATNPAASTPAGAMAASAPPVPAAGQSSVHISVTHDSWVSVRQADGKEVMSGLLHAGDARDAVGTPPLQFVIGNRAGLEALQVNGAPVDPSKYANAKGNVARFSLP
jgi:cytoskeleton protein RodZ